MKKKFNFKKLIYLVIIAILLWSVGAIYISNHEEIHYDIFRRYGINSNISINYLKLEGEVMPESKNYKNCTELCFYEHFLNDLVGYYLDVIIYFILVLTLIIFMLQEKRE